MMKGIYRMKRLHSELKRVANILYEPDHLINPMEEDSNANFWRLVYLRNNVKMVMK
jgi:hypothetical protein